MRIWGSLFAVLLLTKPDGGPIWIVDSQIAAIFAAPGIGGSPTAVATLAGTFYVRESAETIAVQLGWKK